MQFKYNLSRTVFFIVMWFIFNGNYISFNEKINDNELFCDIMAPSFGFNNAILLIGIVYTAFFIIGHYSLFGNMDVYRLTRLGRIKFLNRRITGITFDSLLTAAEFWGSNIILALLFVDFGLMKEHNFFIASLLYVFILFLYFLIVGTYTMLIGIICSFKKTYIIISTALFVVLSAMEYWNIRITPALYTMFLDEWLYSGSFSAPTYLINSAMSVILILIAVTLSKILFIKKDIITNEK